MRIIIATLIVFCCCGGRAEDILRWDNGAVSVSSPGTVTARAINGGAMVEFKTTAPWPYVLLKPKEGKSWNLSRYAMISFE